MTLRNHQVITARVGQLLLGHPAQLQDRQGGVRRILGELPLYWQLLPVEWQLPRKIMDGFKAPKLHKVKRAFKTRGLHFKKQDEGTGGGKGTP